MSPETHELIQHYKMGHSPSLKGIMSSSMNLGVTSVKAELNILASYSIIPCKLAHSPSPKGGIHDKVIS